MRNVLDSGLGIGKLAELASGERVSDWVNLGGQLMPESEVDRLRADIRSGILKDWNDIHARYNELWKQYPEQKLRHSLHCLKAVMGDDILDKDRFGEAMARERRIVAEIAEKVSESREKDMVNPFRRATYRNEAEMVAAVGTLEDNSFVKQVRKESAEMLEALEGLAQRL